MISSNTIKENLWVSVLKNQPSLFPSIQTLKGLSLKIPSVISSWICKTVRPKRKGYENIMKEWMQKEGKKTFRETDIETNRPFPFYHPSLEIPIPIEEIAKCSVSRITGQKEIDKKTRVRLSTEYPPIHFSKTNLADNRTSTLKMLPILK